MKLHEARSSLKNKNMTLRHHEGEYRVNHKGGKEATAYHTNNLPDAVATGHMMASRAETLNAKANLLREQRLAHKTEFQHKIGEEAAKIGEEAAKLENGRTQDSLSKLGAGKEYGE